MATGTWAKLKSGNWGARVAPAIDAVEGATVTLTTKAGKQESKTIERVIWRNPDGSCALCSLYVVPRATSVKAPRANWRPCGYPGCSPGFCDDCDGEGAKGSYSNADAAAANFF